MTDTLTTTAPERIWLQVDTSADQHDRSEPFPDDYEGVTWEAESIGGQEVEYVRADLYDALASELCELRAATVVPVICKYGIGRPMAYVNLPLEFTGKRVRIVPVEAATESGE